MMINMHIVAASITITVKMIVTRTMVNRMNIEISVHIIMRTRHPTYFMPSEIARMIRICVVMMVMTIVIPTVVNYRTIPRVVQRMPKFRNCCHCNNCCSSCHCKNFVVINSCFYSRTMESLYSNFITIIYFILSRIDSGIVVTFAVIVVVIVLSLECVATQSHYQQCN